ncbi:proline-rich receptor-like protein kinase PERK8 [Oxyura jamaicensis]|uniref:proline-rich receptor-like protein kinase PERK8 n=1 Tax=Oxyura jamaicensis TaxID=8884 RepID=UPI0015A676F4|nr:proline-rich receptor-like protein kinase PERK8 [Oxyura jamaicensis]
MTVAPVEAVSGRFLLLGGPGGPLQPGEVLRLQLRDLGPPPAPRLYHVLAVARGRLVAAQAVQRGTVTEVTLPVTPAMTPRLRVVAFFQAEGQLVAASWGAPVGDSCGGQVRVVVPPPGAELRPQASLTVTVTTGTPATVALGAIDTAVLALEPRHRLGPAKVTPRTPNLAPPKPGDTPPPPQTQHPKAPSPGDPQTPHALVPKPDAPQTSQPPSPGDPKTCCPET